MLSKVCGYKSDSADDMIKAYRVDVDEKSFTNLIDEWSTLLAGNTRHFGG